MLPLEGERGKSPGLKRNVNHGTQEHTSSPADKAFGKRETKQLKKGLTRDEFDRSFNPIQVGEFVPIAAKMLDADCHSSSGAVLRPKHSEESQVERILQDKKEDEEIRSYTEVHLP